MVDEEDADKVEQTAPQHRVCREERTRAVEQRVRARRDEHDDEVTAYCDEVLHASLDLISVVEREEKRDDREHNDRNTFAVALAGLAAQLVR